MTSNTEWQLAGNSAELYEQFLVPVIFVPYAQYLLSQSDLETGNNVLDVACGTGIVARMVKARVGATGRVAGVDLNAGMLAVAKLVTPSGLIEWIAADVGQIPLEDELFDVAYCQQGLQFFPDKVGAIREITRLLKPNGTYTAIVAKSLDQNPLMSSQVAALTKHIGKDAAAGIRVVCELSNGEEIAGLFVQAGLRDVEWHTLDLTLYHPDGRAFVKNGILSTPAAETIATWSDDDRNALVDDILEGFGEFYDGKSLIFPHVSSVVRGRK